MTMFKFHVARRITEPVQCSACQNFYRAVVELSYPNRMAGSAVVLCALCIESFNASLTVMPADWAEPVEEVLTPDEGKK
jgi:hypothetical protein